MRKRRGLADDAHQPVLYLLPQQNRELSYASSVGASRVKALIRSWYFKDSELSPKMKGACEVSAGLRLVNLLSPVSRFKTIIIKKSSYPVKTANRSGQANK